MSAVLVNDRRHRLSLRALRPLAYAGRFVQAGEIIDVAQEDATGLIERGAASCRLDAPNVDGEQQVDMNATCDVPRSVIVREPFELDGRTYAAGETAALPESIVRVLFMRGLVLVA
jgi:hypothetical protein